MKAITNLRTQKIRKVVTYLFLLISCCFALAPSMAPVAKMAAPDNEFTMEVVRKKDHVKVTMHFADATQYAYMDLEKCPDSSGNFRQCSYVSLKKEELAEGPIVACDNYPLPRAQTAYYRIRTVSLDRIERIYPPVCLPGYKP